MLEMLPSWMKAIGKRLHSKKVFYSVRFFPHAVLVLLLGGLLILFLGH